MSPLQSCPDVTFALSNLMSPRTDLWCPLLMSFCRFYGLGEEVISSRLAEIPEQAYRPAAHMVR